MSPYNEIPFQSKKKVDINKINSQLVQTMNQQSGYIAAKISTEQPSRQIYYLYDSFTRADSATALGNGETNNSPWVLTSTGSTVWGITNNQAYVVSTTTPGRSIAYQETNEADCIIETDIAQLGSFNNGLAFRVTDRDNFWLFTISPGSFTLGKYVATAITNVVVKSGTYTAGKLTIYLKGNKIEVYLDGFLLTRVYDNFNSTATKHGLYSRADDFAFRWETFSVRALSPVTYNFKEGFENSLSSWYWTKETPNLSHSQTLSNVIKKEGNKSLRIELRKDDPDVANSKRCELVLPSEEALEEHWYGVSIYLPKGGDEDFANDASAEILMQWHNTPDVPEENVSPPLALQTQNGKYYIAQRWDANRTTSQQGISQLLTELGSYEQDKGVWVDWVFHVKWGWLGVQNPITEVYKNGVLVYQKNGYANTFNDQKGIFQKLGIYKWEWKSNPTLSSQTKRVVYYDNYFLK